MSKRSFIGRIISFFYVEENPNKNPPKKSVYSAHNNNNENNGLYDFTRVARDRQMEKMLREMTGKSKSECKKIAKKYR